MLIILTGFTAVGKDRYQAALIEQSTIKLSKLITYTTRPERAAEIDGVDYHFISDEKFESMKDQFVGIREYSSQNLLYKYGINKLDLSKSENHVIILDPDGAVEIKQSLPKGLVSIIYLEATKEEIFFRAGQRGDDFDHFINRLQKDTQELENLKPHIDVVINTSGNISGLENNIKVILNHLEENDE